MEKLLRRLLLVLVGCAGLSVNGQSLKVDGEKYYWEADFLAGLNSDGWQADLGASYFINQYFGIKASVGLAGEIEELGDWGGEDLPANRHYVGRFKFMPSLVIRSPRLISWESQGVDIYLFTEPGIILSPGAKGSKNPQVFSWDLNSGVNVQVDRWIFFAGYGISNYCLYSGKPINSYGGRASCSGYITHSGFVGAAYKF